jgi:hypothetical protein
MIERPADEVDAASVGCPPETPNRHRSPMRSVVNLLPMARLASDKRLPNGYQRDESRKRLLNIRC